VGATVTIVEIPDCPGVKLIGVVAVIVKSGGTGLVTWKVIAADTRETVPSEPVTVRI
jgi:hypothetical protein